MKTTNRESLQTLTKFLASEKASVKALVHNFECDDEVIEQATEEIEDYLTQLSADRAYRGPDPAARLLDLNFNTISRRST